MWHVHIVIASDCTISTKYILYIYIYVYQYKYYVTYHIA